MPLAQIHLVEGRTPEQKRALISAVTEAIAESLQTPKGNIRVVLYEIPPDHWAAGNITITERRAGASS